MDADINYDINEEKHLCYGEAPTQTTNAERLLTEIELGLGFSSEKVFNLGMLSMLVAARSDFEVLPLENEASLVEAQKALEYDILLVILKSEVKEQEIFLDSIQQEVIVVHQEIYSVENFERELQSVKGKLWVAEKSLMKSYDQFYDVKQQADKYRNTLASVLHSSWSEINIESSENIDLNSTVARSKEDVLDYSKQTLQILERSLAREFDLEKRLSVLEHCKEELSLKLELANHKICEIEEELSSTLKRYFQADNATELFTALSKELIDSFQSVQALSRDQVNALEKKLTDSDVQLKKAKASIEASQEQKNLLNSKLMDAKNIIMDLKEKLLKAENRAENAEAKYDLLAEYNLELNLEIGFLKSSETDRAYSLKEKLKDSDTQLEHAKTSYEAIEEQQRMLHSALVDMKNLIEDLKSKVSIAEKRAEKAESKCDLLTVTNQELNDELGDMRCRLDYLGESMHKAERAKVETASEINTKTKVITDLVMRLALERERLQKQILILKKENRILVKKCWETIQPSNGHSACDETGKENSSQRFPGKEAIESSTASIKAENSAAEVASPQSGSESSGLTDDETDVDSDSVAVRTIEAGQLNCRHVCVALFLLLATVVGMYIYQVE